MPAGLGGGNYLAFCFETVMGTYLPPTTSGTVFMPILTESLAYSEDKYYSPQIRQSTIVSEVEQSYYSVAGDVQMEVDTLYMPYWLYCSRYSITKTGPTPFLYKYVPSTAGAASTASGTTTRKTASITVVRNGIGFGYAGCVVGGHEFTIEDGVLKVTWNVLGLSEAEPAGLGSPGWSAANIMGAAAHSIFVDASGTAPAFAGGADLTFNGFTFTVGFNAAAQNRIRADRSASYISFGETEATYTTELDFLSRAEYDNYKNAATRAIRLRSLNNGVAFGAAGAGSTDAMQITVNRSAYDAYEVGTPAMGDLVMASVTGRALGIAGGDPYAIEVKSVTDIT